MPRHKVRKQSENSKRDSDAVKTQPLPGLNFKNYENLRDMKKLLLMLLTLLLAFFIFLSCYRDECIIEEKNYNEVTDAYINDLLNSTPISMEVKIWEYRGAKQYIITYCDARIICDHYWYIPYQQPDRWEYDANYKDGRVIMIQSPLDLPLHKIAPQTYGRIQKLCIDCDK